MGKPLAVGSIVAIAFIVAFGILSSLSGPRENAKAPRTQESQTADNHAAAPEMRILAASANETIELPAAPWMLTGGIGYTATDEGPVFRLDDGTTLHVEVSYAGYGTWIGNGLGNRFLLTAYTKKPGTEERLTLADAARIQGGCEAPWIELRFERAENNAVRLVAAGKSFEWKVPGEIEAFSWQSTAGNPPSVRLHLPVEATGITQLPHNGISQ